MKVLRHLFRLLGLHREAPKPPVFPQPPLDLDEFSRLLCSRRIEDLRTLAKKLSQEPKAHA
jgi:hypothetical protein